MVREMLSIRLLYVRTATSYANENAKWWERKVSEDVNNELSSLMPLTALEYEMGLILVNDG